MDSVGWVQYSAVLSSDCDCASETRFAMFVGFRCVPNENVSLPYEWAMTGLEKESNMCEMIDRIEE